MVGKGGHVWFGMLGGLTTCAREVAGDFGQSLVGIEIFDPPCWLGPVCGIVLRRQGTSRP